MIRKEAAAVYQKIVLEGGHFYVCGDCTMAEHVYQMLKLIIQERGGMLDSEVESYMLTLRVSQSTEREFCVCSYVCGPNILIYLNV